LVKGFGISAQATASGMPKSTIQPERRQELAVNVSLMWHAQSLAGVDFFIHGDEQRISFCCVASDKPSYLAGKPPFRVLLKSTRNRPAALS